MQKSSEIKLIIFAFFLYSFTSFAEILPSGSYSLTSNVSADAPRNFYFSHKMLLTLKQSESAHSLEIRDENYTESSFHGIDPNEVVLENKAEMQLNYNFTFNENLAWYIGALRHANYTFRDSYSWYLTGLSGNYSPVELFAINASLTAIYRGQGGRIFYDGSLSIEKKVWFMFSIFASLHRYENFGESDVSPTLKKEYEIGVNHTQSSKFSYGLSYFKHTQDNDSLDSFRAYRFRLTYSF